MKRFTKEKSPRVKTKAKTGTKKKKSGGFGDEKKKILADSDKGSWFDQPSQISEEKPGDEHCSTSSESVVGISRKKKSIGNELARRKKGYHRATSKHKPGLFFPRDFMSFTRTSLQSRVGTLLLDFLFLPRRLLCFCFRY